MTNPRTTHHHNVPETVKISGHWNNFNVVVARFDEEVELLVLADSERWKAEDAPWPPVTCLISVAMYIKNRLVAAAIPGSGFFSLGTSQQQLAIYIAAAQHAALKKGTAPRHQAICALLSDVLRRLDSGSLPVLESQSVWNETPKPLGSGDVWDSHLTLDESLQPFNDQ